MKYLLMNKDNIVAEIGFDAQLPEMVYTLGQVYGKLPYGFVEINKWLGSRQAAKHRKHLERLMRECGCLSLEGYIRVLHCVGINDTFWVKREDESVTWNDVSLFDNEFDATITRIAFEGAGLYGEKFTSTSPEFSIEGSYEKCCVRENGDLYLIKRGTAGYANAGLEPYGEVFSYPIYKHIVGVSTEYELVHYHGSVASKCKLFSNDIVGFSPYARLSGGMAPNLVYSFYKDIGFYETFCAMLVADAVCFNADRHSGNHGALYNNDTMEILCMAPPFDHNLALLPYAMKSDFPDIWGYIAQQGPRIGDDWIQVAKSVLTSEIRRKLISLKGYTIPFKGDEKFPAERVELLNRLINEQIDKILK